MVASTNIGQLPNYPGPITPVSLTFVDDGTHTYKATISALAAAVSNVLNLPGTYDAIGAAGAAAAGSDPLGSAAAVHTLLTALQTSLGGAAYLNVGQIAGTVAAGDDSRFGSGGGITIIPDGGTMSGTYNGDVLCAGSAIITDTLVINGDLFVVNNLSYVQAAGQGGYAINVLGDVYIVGDCNLSTYDQVTVQNNISITGDFNFNSFSLKTNPSNEILMQVGGNLITNLSDDFDGSGNLGAPGLNLVVYGSINAWYIDLSGGTSVDSSPGGAAGYLYCYGDMVVADGLDVYGGQDNNNLNAGNGGYLMIYGDTFIASINANGGSSTANGNGGSGGTIACGGTLTCYYLQAIGGNTNSTNVSSYAGQGGYVNCTNLDGQGIIYLQGGNVTGTLSSSPEFGISSPNGGRLSVYGDIVAFEIALDGGQITANYSGTANGPGGSGGTLQCVGDINVSTLTATGGLTQGGFAGGNGGFIYVTGKMISQMLLDVSGGNTESAGRAYAPAGQIQVLGGLVAVAININDGASPGGSPTSTTTGLYLGGYCQINLLNQVERTGSVITSYNNIGKIMLQISAMSGKTTFTSPGGADTQDTSPYWQTSVFSYDSNAGWRVITGTSLT